MKTTIRSFAAAVLVALFSAGCEDYINDVEPLKDYAPDDKLNTEENIDFLTTGVLSQFAEASSNTAALTDLLSDQLIFTNQMPLATYPTYAEIESGDILLDNSNVDQVFQAVCRLRKVADDLVRRTALIAFSDTTKREYAFFVGYLYGGLARYYMGTSFAVNTTTPGGVIDAGPFIPQATLLDDAITLMTLALNHQPDAAEQRVVHSLIARVYLAKKDYVNAAAQAALGMQAGDAPSVCRYNDVSSNYYWLQAGNGRQQMGVSPRFPAYVTADPGEAARIPLGTVVGRDHATYYYQEKYLESGSSFIVMTWQENTLMLAECAERGSGPGSPLALANAVRASHGLGALSSIDLAGIMVERDKELFCQGSRLLDQNRGAVAAHLPPGSWNYLPIPQRERDSNPNLPAL